jgi:spore maturation protein CgeB
MKIAYIGTKSGTSLQRARALGRLGHDVYIIDPWAWLQGSALSTRIHFHSGYVMAGAIIDKKIKDEVKQSNADLVWVNQGEFLGPSIIKKIRELDVPIINYANDNPFSPENKLRFNRYRTALPYYDLVVVVFAHIVDLARNAGARKVIRKYISADEVAHLRQTCNSNGKDNLESDVVFVGTWMREYRSSFIADLIRLGVPVSIWGDRWHKAREWKTIEPHWRGPGVYEEGRYATILRSAKICLGLINKAAGNLHTDRSIQIPALGSVLCAERTSEHLAMYEEGTQAVFWSDAVECASLCKKLLANESERQEIARLGYKRAIKNNLFNEPVLASIIEEIKG